MSRRRRRLWGAAVVGVAVWATAAVLAGPPAQAVGVAPSPPVAPAASSGVASSLADLDTVVLRPLAVLRSAGEAGVVIAHRGDSLAAPENTMPAFISSISRGADYLELDIRLSKDGIPVVIHDSTVDRTTDGTGLVSEMTLAELRALDAGSWLSESFANTRIPTLEEVLAVARGKDTRVVIEYKGTWKKPAIRTTVGMIAAAGLADTALAQSFSEKTVARIAAVAPRLKLALLTEDLDASTVATAKSIGADAVNPRIATARGVALAHRARLGVFVWTQDAAADWDVLTAMGVDGIITNRPDALRAGGR
jgi:glycerophosphoryl diester phosphodiesterase